MSTELVRKKNDREDILGHFAEEADYDILIQEDTDLYALDPLNTDKKDEDNVIFKLRKGVFSEYEQKNAYEGLRGAATLSQNRGMAGGPRSEKLANRDWVFPYQEDVLNYFVNPPGLVEQPFPEKSTDSLQNDVRGKVWLRTNIEGEPWLIGSDATISKEDYSDWFDKWAEMVKPLPKDQQRKEAKRFFKAISDTNYAEPVMSGIAGFFDRYPRIPFGRACSYNKNNPQLFEKSFPYLEKLNEVFRKELPVRWGNQNECASKLDSRFRISDTVFTTLTVNHNWRTAGHRDAGDLTKGFSNISTIGRGWKGAYFVLPEYRVAVNLQPGDLLLVNNHEGIHTNTAFEGDDNDRLSIVAYFREKMLNLKSWEYEELREKFVDSRRLNKEHPEWHERWNGISRSMWASEEWAEYLEEYGMKDEDGVVGRKKTLANFFE